MVLDGAIDPAADPDQLQPGPGRGLQRRAGRLLRRLRGPAGLRRGSPAGTCRTRLRRLDGRSEGPSPARASAAGPWVPARPSTAWPSRCTTAPTGPTWPPPCRRASRGDGSLLLRFSDLYTTRNSRRDLQQRGGGQHRHQLPGRALAEGSRRLCRADAAQAMARAPEFGVADLYGGLTCSLWPLPATRPPHPVTAPGSPPIVVIGSTGDPATPYAGAQALAGRAVPGRAAHPGRRRPHRVSGQRLHPGPRRPLPARPDRAGQGHHVPVAVSRGRLEPWRSEPRKTPTGRGRPRRRRPEAERRPGAATRCGGRLWSRDLRAALAPERVKSAPGRARPLRPGRLGHRGPGRRGLPAGQHRRRWPPACRVSRAHGRPDRAAGVGHRPGRRRRARRRDPAGGHRHHQDGPHPGGRRRGPAGLGPARRAQPRPVEGGGPLTACTSRPTRPASSPARSAATWPTTRAAPTACSTA